MRKLSSNQKTLLKLLRKELRQKEKLSLKIVRQYVVFDDYNRALLRYERSSGLKKFLFSAPKLVPIPMYSVEQFEQLSRYIYYLKSEIKKIESIKNNRVKVD
ncbi:hypothetical protein [Lactococcus lactis]|uniref:hypothetical protein n=1 Tax=Lactococcus lactis TaxID=1358 RepID=UPI00288CE3FD|nr:hypothetical protein [Lactococcus lactis]MDT2904827.1 hypothetical protein [Lactococcus lactis]MDT2911335.1 hypothetical protein [Lactococcus lactis]MDT2933012.1 hypothetical protein [Lactococcus lactis]MDT2937872.1 hypothetical protein [Lactococcus lactis]